MRSQLLGGRIHLGDIARGLIGGRLRLGDIARGLIGGRLRLGDIARGLIGGRLHLGDISGRLSPAPAGSPAWSAPGSGGSPFAASSAVRMTFVPQPEGSIETVPLACSPSQATVCSGSSLVIVISPKAPRCF